MKDTNRNKENTPSNIMNEIRNGRYIDRVRLKPYLKLQVKNF